MTDQTTRPVRGGAPVTVFCRRLERMRPLTEHLECPYCFGGRQEIADGWYDRFCGFVPGKDPIHFGFPPDSSRNLES